MKKGKPRWKNLSVTYIGEAESELIPPSTAWERRQLGITTVSMDEKLVALDDDTSKPTRAAHATADSLDLSSDVNVDNLKEEARKLKKENGKRVKTQHPVAQDQPLKKELPAFSEIGNILPTRCCHCGQLLNLANPASIGCCEHCNRGVCSWACLEQHEAQCPRAVIRIQGEMRDVVLRGRMLCWRWQRNDGRGPR